MAISTVSRAGHNAARPGTGEVGFQRRSSTLPDHELSAVVSTDPVQRILDLEPGLRARVSAEIAAALDDEYDDEYDDAEWFVDYRIDGRTTDTDEPFRSKHDITADRVISLAAQVDQDDCESYGLGRHTVVLRSSTAGDVTEIVTYDLTRN